MGAQYGNRLAGAGMVREGCSEEAGLCERKPGGDEDRSGTGPEHGGQRCRAVTGATSLFCDSENGQASGAGGGCHRVHLPGICRTLWGQTQAVPGGAQGAGTEGAAHLDPGEPLGCPASGEYRLDSAQRGLGHALSRGQQEVGEARPWGEDTRQESDRAGIVSSSHVPLCRAVGGWSESTVRKHTQEALSSHSGLLHK